MADSLADIMNKERFVEPDEVLIIKNYLMENYEAGCRIEIQPNQIIINVQGASLAGTLRMKLHELQALCNTKKRLVIRIV